VELIDSSLVASNRLLKNLEREEAKLEQ
jgi:hypothetical protein